MVLVELVFISQIRDKCSSKKKVASSIKLKETQMFKTTDKNVTSNSIKKIENEVSKYY